MGVELGVPVEVLEDVPLSVWVLEGVPVEVTLDVSVWVEVEPDEPVCVLGGVPEEVTLGVLEDVPERVGVGEADCDDVDDELRVPV